MINFILTVLAMSLYGKTICAIVFMLIIGGLFASIFPNNSSKNEVIKKLPAIEQKVNYPAITKEEMDNLRVLAEKQKLSYAQHHKVAQVLKNSGFPIDKPIISETSKLCPEEEIIRIPNSSSNPNINNEHSIVVSFLGGKGDLQYVGVSTYPPHNCGYLYLYDRANQQDRFPKLYNHFKLGEIEYVGMKQNITRRMGKTYIDPTIKELRLYYGFDEHKHFAVIAKGIVSGVQREDKTGNINNHKFTTEYAFK